MVSRAGRLFSPCFLSVLGRPLHNFVIEWPSALHCASWLRLRALLFFLLSSYRAFMSMGGFLWVRIWGHRFVCEDFWGVGVLRLLSLLGSRGQSFALVFSWGNFV